MLFASFFRCSRDKDVTRLLSQPLPLSQNCSEAAIAWRDCDSEGLMSTQLIADAVRNSRGDDRSTLWDRLFAFWFRRLVYTQIWEDPEADLAALRLPVGSTIVTISSGGCNALSYLTAQPAQVFAVDLNEAHLSLAQAQAGRASGVLEICRLLAVLRRGGFAGQCRAVSRPAVALARRGCARLLGQAQPDRPAAPPLFHRRLLSPRHARPLHRSRPYRRKTRSHRPQGPAQRQSRRRRSASRRSHACIGCFIRRWPG